MREGLPWSALVGGSGLIPRVMRECSLPLLRRSHSTSSAPRIYCAGLPWLRVFSEHMLKHCFPAQSLAATTLPVAMSDDSDDDPPPEWVAHQEYMRVLWRSTEPLFQIAANIETIDWTLCGIGQRLEDERTLALEMFDALEDDTADFLAKATRSLLAQIANTCIPTLIGQIRVVRHLLDYARAQVHSFPSLVASQDFLCQPNPEFTVTSPPAGEPILIPHDVAASAAPTLEDVQGVSTADEYRQALRRSTNPLSQLLATFEDSDVVLCAIGRLLLDEHGRLRAWNRTLAASGRPLAAAIIQLFEPLVHERFPTLIVNTHTARHAIIHVRQQVRAYPALVDRQTVPRTTLVDFEVCDPPIRASTHTLRHAGAVFRPPDQNSNQCGST